MKFGIFLPNGSNGYILSTASPQYAPTFAHNLAITRAAEDCNMDFVLSMMKFRGFGGETGYWDQCLESLTLMAGLAVGTSTIELYPSIAVLNAHPAVTARMVSTIDDISGGRCGLNIVTGWNKPEYTQMGLWLGDDYYYDRRYEYAAEYLTILKELWRTGSATRHSEFFDLEDCAALPTPSREVRIVRAGQSPRGLAFTAEFGDHNFVMTDQGGLRRITTALQSEASRHGRRAGTYALFTVIAADRGADADLIAESIVQSADTGAITNVLASASLDGNPAGTSAALQAGLAAPLDKGNIAFMGFPVLKGPYESVAEQLDMLAATTEIDGIMLSFPSFVDDIRNFGARVMPRLAAPRVAG
jgi:pyrimidine oxygenase